MEKASFIERTAYKYFIRLAKDKTTDEYYILNPGEIKRIHRIKLAALFVAALCGAYGVIFLYLPQYPFETFFNSLNFTIRILGFSIEIPTIATIWSIILLIIELRLLTLTNLIAVHHIAQVCGFPDTRDKYYEENVKELIYVGMEKKQTKQLSLGINPYQGISRASLFVFFLINQLKATVSNAIFKLFVRRILGRLALRFVMDMAGIPVYAFWDAWASHLVIHEAKARILASQLIRKLSNQLSQKYKDNEQFKSKIYDTLSLIAILKRTFHYNHYVLAKTILEEFSLQPQSAEHVLSKDFLQQIKTLDPEIRTGIIKLLIFGILIDGEVSYRERQAINKLKEDGIITFDFSLVKKWSKDFTQGKGLEELFKMS